MFCKAVSVWYSHSLYRDQRLAVGGVIKPVVLLNMPCGYAKRLHITAKTPRASIVTRMLQGLTSKHAAQCCDQYLMTPNALNQTMRRAASAPALSMVPFECEMHSCKFVEMSLDSLPLLDVGGVM